MFFSKCTDAVRKPAWCFLTLLSTTGSLSCSSRGVKVFRWELFHLPQHLYCPKSTWEQIYNRKRKDCVVMCCLQCGRWARNLEGDGMTPLPGHVCSDTTTERLQRTNPRSFGIVSSGLNSGLIFWHLMINSVKEKKKKSNLLKQKDFIYSISECHQKSKFFNLPISSSSMKCRSW